MKFPGVLHLFFSENLHHVIIIHFNQNFNKKHVAHVIYTALWFLTEKDTTVERTSMPMFSSIYPLVTRLEEFIFLVRFISIARPVLPDTTALRIIRNDSINLP